MNNKKVWLVTGASQGLGLSLVNRLLEQGYQVAATSRSKSTLEKQVSSANENFLPLSTDLVNEQSVQESIQQAIKHFGRIDVVVNNAGYGMIGALEELSDAEARSNFDVNVFGALNVIRATMPHLRKQKSGHIFNISSIGGFVGNFPGWGIYCATKFAMAGFTESLAEEAKEFNVKATIVLPGYFRTNFLTPGSLAGPKNPIHDYQAVRQSQDFHQKTMDGNQQGDPEKLADVMIDIAGKNEAPLYLFLGSDAWQGATKKMKVLDNDLKKWKEESYSTDFAVTA